MTDEPAARPRWNLTPEAFGKMLERLAPDRHQAGVEFEQLRRRLVIFFSCEGVLDAEAWADETLDRVARRLDGGTEVENVQAFTRGVARLVRHEARQVKSREARTSQEFRQHQIEKELPGSKADVEARHKCLEKCLESLTPANRRLVIEYYEGEKGARIANRERMARDLGITVESSRNKALGIRKRLESCMEDASASGGAK